MIHPYRTRQCLMIVACILIIPVCSALYDFEGLPLKVVANGEVDGDVLTFGTYGLRDPPVMLEFDVPSEIVWARTYIAVWGGTPRYTGWVGLTVNDGNARKTDLFGKDDMNANVYVTGYGVYWVTYDTTSQLVTGHNTLTATTSRTDPDNKLDGRVYTVVTVVVVKDSSGSTTRYWVAEGNENLHGEGWSGTSPTVHEEANITFSGVDPSGATSANLTTLYLASAKGQPDYTLLNGKDLGNIETDTSMYPAGARDIADETSFNAGHVSPIGSRYVDMEVFDVKNIIRTGDNRVVFQRGRDLNGDGVITASGEKPEGEDYLHPVLAMLTLKKPRAAATTPDLSIEKIVTENAYTGGTATITATVRNLGAATTEPATVIFSADGTEISSIGFTVDPSGLQQVTGSWIATTGTHSITAEVRHPKDTGSANNIARQEVTIGSLPDLSVSIGNPVQTGGDDGQQKSPSAPGLAICAAIIGALLLVGRRPGRPAALALSLMIVLASGAILPASVAADGDTRAYTLPVTVKNIGGSDAGAFTISVYLDGEKVTVKEITDGLAAGKELVVDIPLHTNPSTHEVRVVVDEDGKVKDADRANNSAAENARFP